MKYLHIAPYLRHQKHDCYLLLFLESLSRCRASFLFKDRCKKEPVAQPMQQGTTVRGTEVRDSEGLLFVTCGSCVTTGKPRSSEKAKSGSLQDFSYHASLLLSNSCLMTNASVHCQQKERPESMTDRARCMSGCHFF